MGQSAPAGSRFSVHEGGRPRETPPTRGTGIEDHTAGTQSPLTTEELSALRRLIQAGSLSPEPMSRRKARRRLAATLLTGTAVWALAIYGAWHLLS